MKFQIVLAIVILSCLCCSMTSADVEGTLNKAGNVGLGIFGAPECSTFEKCYAGCSWLNLCSIFKSGCKDKCAIECGCHHSAANANFKLTGIHYVFGVMSLLIALRSSL